MPTGRSSELDVTPSMHRSFEVNTVSSQDLPDSEAIGVLIGSHGELPAKLGVDRAALETSGFTGALGQTLVLPSAERPVTVLVGVGPDAPSIAGLRDAAASFANAVTWASSLALAVPEGDSPAAIAEALIEGVFLARYNFGIRHRTNGPVPVERLTLAAGQDLGNAVERGKAIVAASLLGRDLANCPAGFLTATRIADVAVEVGERTGIGVEVFDQADLIELGCGGLLGVNLGSNEEARMVRLRYTPAGESNGVLTLVGKGIMYDSGGISLKPSDGVHATMKNDMSGAGSVLAAMSALPALGCRSTVIGYLMCTDNMAGGSAMKLGDVLTMRDGTTVEILNTDAEGRLVMADALVLATEEHTDAIIDIATLTGACLRTFGSEIAGVLGNDQTIIDQIERSAELTDEPVWQLPMARRYRRELNSPIADMTNLGGPNAGTITAALFLEDFVKGIPWGHIDIAGTGQSDRADAWRPKGATGFGTRLLINVAENFTVPETRVPSRTA